MECGVHNFRPLIYPLAVSIVHTTLYINSDINVQTSTTPILKSITSYKMYHMQDIKS